MMFKRWTQEQLRVWCRTNPIKNVLGIVLHDLPLCSEFPTRLAVSTTYTNLRFDMVSVPFPRGYHRFGRWWFTLRVNMAARRLSKIAQHMEFDHGFSRKDH